MLELLQRYYQLTKPGIVYGNAITVIAGLFLASKGHLHIVLFLTTLLGISLVIAGACACNNYLDREIDEKMVRTKKRALVIGSIPLKNAIIYAIVLELIGFGFLIRYTNTLTVLTVAIGLIDYVVLYGLAKRRSVHGTVVGSISGAVPLVAGYMAVADHLGIEALLLFIIMALWQMPHFYSIAIYRLKEYSAADIPVLPREKGIHVTKLYVMAYIAAFVIANLFFSWEGYTGYTYAIIMGIVSLGWLWRGIRGFKTSNDNKWGRSMFQYSLIVVMVLSIMLSISSVAP